MYLLLQLLRRADWRGEAVFSGTSFSVSLDSIGDGWDESLIHARDKLHSNQDQVLRSELLLGFLLHEGRQNCLPSDACVRGQKRGGA
jgi:hypothetical protein